MTQRANAIQTSENWDARFGPVIWLMPIIICALVIFATATLFNQPGLGIADIILCAEFIALIPVLVISYAVLGISEAIMLTTD